MHMKKNSECSRNGLTLIFVRHKEMFQQYLFYLSYHQAYIIQYHFQTVS